MNRIFVKINSNDFKKKIKKANAKISNLRQFFKDIAEFELSDTLLRYKKEISPNNEAWRIPKHAIRGTYARGSKKRPFDSSVDKILYRSGNLFNSISYLSDDKSAIIGTNIRYGYYLQNNLGFPFIGISENTEKNINKAFLLMIKDIKEAIK